MLRNVIALIMLLLAARLSAQQRLLTIDDLYDPNKKLDFSGAPQSGFTWLDDNRFLWPKRDAKGNVSEFAVMDVSGSGKKLFDPKRLEVAAGKIVGVSAEQARALGKQRSYNLNPAFNGAVVSIADDLYYYPLDSEKLTRLTFDPFQEEEFTFSPNGKMLAFVRNNNLFIIDLDDRRERALTTSGGPQLLNGKLDWVYQEEIYGRGTYRSYWWSPDSATLAYLQLDETPVPEFTVVDHIPYRQTLEVEDYPKAGDPNPTVKLFTVSSAGGPSKEVDLTRYGAAEFLVVNVDWTPDSESVVFAVQNREQTWLDLNLGKRSDGTATTVLRETSKSWVNENGNPKWIDNDSFLWLSERNGWKHIYHYERDGTLIRQVTDGRWEVRTLHGVDRAKSYVYFSGTERSAVGGDVYRIKLDGTGLQRLSAAEGAHSAIFSPSFSYFIDSWSDPMTPQQVFLLRSDGTTLRTLDANKVELLSQFALIKPEFVQVKTRDGFVMEAMMIKPKDFNPARKYPVFQYTYAGPHAQQVRNAWGGVFNQLLAQNGILVWICDNRTASGKGQESTDPLFHNFGELELRDIEDGLAWLKQQPYVDGDRVLISGWSYGGFMVSYALTHSKSFSAGIAGGSVTDWRDYDSIYTERYMGLPQTNPEGYRKSSPRYAAAELHGNLLLIHGLIDDNVHVQNTIQFAYELQKAGKPFELMLYPKSRHGVTDPALVKHMRTLMFDFIRRNLLSKDSEN